MTETVAAAPRRGAISLGELSLVQAWSVCQPQVSVRVGKHWTTLPLHLDAVWAPCARCNRAGRQAAYVPFGQAHVKMQPAAVTDAGLVVGVLVYAPRSECSVKDCGWGCAAQDCFFVADAIR